MKHTTRGLFLVLVTSGLAVGCSDEPKTAPNQVKNPRISVKAVEAWSGTARSWVIGEGTARAIEREYLTFENQGRITYIKSGLRVGSSVQASEVLARQDQRKVKADVATGEAGVAEAKTQILVAEAELEQATTEYELAQSGLNRFRVLLEKNSASPQEFDQARAQVAQTRAAVTRARNRIEAARSQVASAEARLRQIQIRLEETEIRSPIKGIVAYLNIEQGTYFAPSVIRTESEQAALSTIPIVVIDPRSYEITVEVPAFQRDLVEPGQESILLLSDEFTQAALGRLEHGRAEQILPLEVSDAFKARGKVYAVNPAVSPGGRSVQIKIRTTEDNNKLQDGVFVTAWIATETRENTVMTPLDAFVYRENQPYIFVVENDRALQRRVTLGIQDFTSQEIVSGVETGEVVVTEGRFQLTEGTPVLVIGGRQPRAASESSQ